MQIVVVLFEGITMETEENRRHESSNQTQI